MSQPVLGGLGGAKIGARSHALKATLAQRLAKLKQDRSALKKALRDQTKEAIDCCYIKDIACQCFPSAGLGRARLL